MRHTRAPIFYSTLGTLTLEKTGCRFGFERVHVKSGESVLVYLYPELHEFSQVDKQGQRHELTGDYNFAFGVKETVASGGGYVEHRVTAV